MTNRITGLDQKTNGHRPADPAELLGRGMFEKDPPAAVTEYTQPWSPESLERIEAYRAARPALQVRIRELLAPEIAPGLGPRTLLEMGAGMGAGNRMLGGLPEDVTLIETDSNPDLLRAPRPNPSRRLKASYPAPRTIPAECAEGVFGIDFFDTLTEPELEAVLADARRIMKPGAALYMIMDAPPILSTEVKNAARARQMVFPYYSQQGEGGMAPEGLFYIDARDYDRVKFLWDEREGFDKMRRYHRFLADYRDNAPLALAEHQADLPEFLTRLYRLCAREGVIQREEPSFSELVLKNLARDAAWAGFAEVSTGQESARERNGLISTVSWVKAVKPAA